jgi:hypothetical protein
MSTEPATVRPAGTTAQRMTHKAFAHRPHVALCGARVSGEEVPHKPLDCHVCAELDLLHEAGLWGPQYV